MASADEARCRQATSNTHHAPFSLHTPSVCRPTPFAHCLCTHHQRARPTPFARLPPSHCDAQTRTTRPESPLGWLAESGVKARGGGSLCSSGRMAVPTSASEEAPPAGEQDSAAHSSKHSSSAICSLRGHLVILLKMCHLAYPVPSCIPCHGTEQRHLYQSSSITPQQTQLTPWVKSSHTDTSLCRQHTHSCAPTQAHTRGGFERHKELGRLAILRHRFVAHSRARSLSSQHRRDTVLALI